MRKARLILLTCLGSVLFWGSIAYIPIGPASDSTPPKTAAPEPEAALSHGERRSVAQQSSIDSKQTLVSRVLPNDTRITKTTRIKFIKESCQRIVGRFGLNGEYSTLQKEEYWGGYSRRPFNWHLRVIDVRPDPGWGGSYTRVFHMRPGQRTCSDHLDEIPARAEG